MNYGFWGNFFFGKDLIVYLTCAVAFLTSFFVNQKNSAIGNMRVYKSVIWQDGTRIVFVSSSRYNKAEDIV